MVSTLLGRIASILGAEEHANGRSLGYVWAFGSVCLTATILLPHPSATNDAGLILVTAVGFLGALALFVQAERFTRAALEALTFVGQLLITALVLIWGAPEAPFLWFHVWLVVHSFHFLPASAAARQIGCAAILFVAATIVTKAPFPAATSVVGVGTITSIGLLVGAFRVRVDELLRESAHSAATDPLTGLANRRAFADAYALDRARRMRSGASGALLLLDLDNFKSINDRLGHAAGDDALRQVASIVSASVREVDRPARLGGDEFAVVLSAPAPGMAQKVAERIRQSFARDDVIGGVRLSIGVVELAPGAGADIDATLAAADRALYEAKARGGDCVSVGALTEPPEPAPTPARSAPASLRTATL